MLLLSDASKSSPWSDYPSIGGRRWSVKRDVSWPTGVEVCHAMVHGGPFPATSDARSTRSQPTLLAACRLPGYLNGLAPGGAKRQQSPEVNPLGGWVA